MEQLESVNVRIKALRTINDPYLNVVVDAFAEALDLNTAGAAVVFIRYIYNRIMDVKKSEAARLISESRELRDTLQALRDWCDENLNGSPAGYHEIMVRADEVLKKVTG